MINLEHTFSFLLALEASEKKTSVRWAGQGKNGTTHVFFISLSNSVLNEKKKKKRGPYQFPSVSS